jgi:hypothetical protein
VWLVKWKREDKMIEQIVISQCGKISKSFVAGDTRSALLRATRLWNVIDSQMQWEFCFPIMLQAVPFVFRDATDANSLYFLY